MERRHDDQEYERNPRRGMEAREQVVMRRRIMSDAGSGSAARVPLSNLKHRSGNTASMQLRQRDFIMEERANDRPIFEG